MHRRAQYLAVFTLLSSLLLSCRVWSSAPILPADQAELEEPLIFNTPLAGQPPIDQVTSTPEAADGQAIPVQMEEIVGAGNVRMGDPAGCRGSPGEGADGTGLSMLQYADTLISLDRSLEERLLTGAWNGTTGRYEYDSDAAFMLDVSDVKNEYLLQRMMNALHVAGMVTWLRKSERQEQGMHILALPLLKTDWASGDWAPYIQAYWQDPLATPEGDAFIVAVQKLPPCAWMVTGGFAPPVDAGWWAANQVGWPDYASAASPYLAVTTSESNQVARKIDWLGAQLEGASTMCGPLSWAIMKDSGAFPPGYGVWNTGPITFWLAKPTKNGRPYSLFPPGTVRVYHYDEPISKFDFNTWPLYPGDFLYTYSIKYGYDHMFVVTEVDPDGSAFTVTNLVQEVPEYRLTIERALLYSPSDPSAGLIYNQWRDRINGRTGHAGFDVMRWDWMVKDIENQPVPYTILPGDTLGMVSVRWKTPADFIAQYNNLNTDASLQVGSVINIPPNEPKRPEG